MTYQDKVKGKHDHAVKEWRRSASWSEYSVGDCGCIRRDVASGTSYAGRIMTPSLNGLNRTYFYVRLSHQGRPSQTVRVANLVAEAFVGPRPEGKHINHIDGNRHNNAAANLEYVTRRQNEDHAVVNALHAWGERHGAHKLVEAQVWEIRSSPLNVPQLAAKFGVSKGCVRSVRLGHTWRHLVSQSSSQDRVQ